MLTATAKVRRPSDGVADFSVGSLHLHREPAKRNNAAVLMLGYARTFALEKGVTLIGGDWNNSAYKYAAQVFPEFMSPDPPYYMCVWGVGGLPPDQQDCCGFVMMPRILEERWIIDNVGTWTFENRVIQIADSDKDAHTPVYMHLIQHGTGRYQRRSKDAMARRRQRTYEQRLWKRRH